MSDLETFDPDELADAEALDRDIDALHNGRAGPATRPELLWLHAAMRADPPAALAARVEARRERAQRRRWRPVRYAAAAMAYLLVSQGLGNLVWGDWVAEGVGDPFSPHAMRESSFALIAAGIAVLAGVTHRRLAAVSAATGVPLGVALGIGGIGEIGVFAPGAVLHLTQGAVAVVLAVTFVRYWRDTSGARHEHRA